MTPGDSRSVKCMDGASDFHTHVNDRVEVFTFVFFFVFDPEPNEKK